MTIEYTHNLLQNSKNAGAGVIGSRFFVLRLRHRNQHFPPHNHTIYIVVADKPFEIHPYQSEVYGALKTNFKKVLIFSRKLCIIQLRGENNDFNHFHAY